jgi:hypothetical protein
MCNECEADGTILPSIESFQMGVNLPKVHYLFYKYFFRPVIGEVNWKCCFAERKRFGTNVAEAYAHALLENNYHAWVYDYITKTPLSTLKTEYEYAKEDNNANKNQGTNDDANESKIFSGDLDKVEIAMPATKGLGDFLLCLDETEDEYKAAQEAALVVMGEVRDTIICDYNSGHGRGHKHSYEKVQEMLARDDSDSTSDEDTTTKARSERARKKRKLMRDLKMYTGSGTKDSNQESEKFKGWLDKGKEFMVTMTKEIKEDIESGLHGQWEKMYRKICKAVKQFNHPEQESPQNYEVDYNILYCEV